MAADSRDADKASAVSQCPWHRCGNMGSEYHELTWLCPLPGDARVHWTAGVPVPRFWHRGARKAKGHEALGNGRPTPLPSEYVKQEADAMAEEADRMRLASAIV